MKFHYILPLCMLSMFIFSCNSETATEANNIKDIFTDSIHVTGKVLIPSERLTDPWSVSIIDSVLLISNQRGEPIMEAYDTTGHLLRQFQSRGFGPLEIRMVGSVQCAFNGKDFYIYDLFESKTLQYSLAAVLKDTACKPTLLASYKDPHPLAGTFDKVYITPYGFIANSRKGKGRFVTFGNDGLNPVYYGQYPAKVDTSLTDDENKKLYGGEIAISPDSTHFAIATYNAGILGLYHLTDHGLDSIWSDNMFLPSHLERVDVGNGAHVVFTSNSLVGYCDIAATNNFVYAIYSGKKLRKSNYAYSNIVHISSWDGQKRYKLLLDKEIDRLTVTPDNSALYGITKTVGGAPQVLVFNIKNLLK